MASAVTPPTPVEGRAGLEPPLSDGSASTTSPALMVWGRHDPFFELAETLSWMKDLPRMDAHILDFVSKERGRGQRRGDGTPCA